MADSPRIEELKRRVQSDPASIAFAALAEEYRRAGRFEEAIHTCTTGLVRHPSYLSAHVTLGRALIEVGKLQEARTELEYVLKLAPENLAAIRGLAEIHHRIGEESVEHHTETAESLSAPVAQPVEQTEPTPAPVIPIKVRVAAAPDVEPTAPLATSADEPPPPRATPAHRPRPVDPALVGLEEFLNAIVRARSQRAAAR